MLEVTKSAIDKIAEYLQDREVKSIRIFLNTGGLAGPSLAMIQDEPKDTDEVFVIDGFKFIVDRDFLKEAAPIKVDYKVSGFKFGCTLKFEEGCTASEICS